MTIATRAPVYAPVRVLMLYLTEDCNLRCTYCFVNKKPRRMTSETARRTVEFFLDRNISGAETELNISFFGGEPFLELDRMEEVIAIARERRPNVYKTIKFAATTNGTVSGPRVERIVKETAMPLLVSLDGDHRAAEHRPFVSGRGSYELVARNLPKLVEWSPNVVVRMTFHPDALDFVGNVRHALELGAPSVALCPVVEASWQGHEEALKAAYTALADEYIDQARRGRLLPLEITHQLLVDLHSRRRPARPCSAGQALLSVDPDGNVMPCHRFLYRRSDWLGNVRERQLDERRWDYVHLSSQDILGCDTCPAQTVCGGGCRLLAVAAGQKLETGANPTECMLMRAHAAAVHRIYETLTAEGNQVFLGSLRRGRPHPSLAGLLES